MSVRDGWRIWRVTLLNNVRAIVSNRADFLAGNAAVLLNTMATAAALAVIFYAGSGFMGWSVPEWLLCLSVVTLSRALWDTFFIGMLDITELVRSGGYDVYRVRPFNSLFLVSTAKVDPDTWGEVLFGVALIGYALSSGTQAGLGVALFVVAGSVVVGVVIYFALHLLVQSAAFWMQDTWPLANLLWRLDDTTSVPAGIYPAPVLYVFTFAVPFAFMSYYPAAFLYGKDGGWLVLLGPVVAAALFAAALSVWRIGNRRYTGAGSAA